MFNFVTNIANATASSALGPNNESVSNTGPVLNDPTSQSMMG